MDFTMRDMRVLDKAMEKKWWSGPNLFMVKISISRPKTGASLDTIRK